MLYKLDWDELKATLLPEDMPTLAKCRQLMVDDMLEEIDQRIALILDQTKDAPRPLTRQQASRYANSEFVIRSMNGRRAKEAVEAIVALHLAVTETIEFKAILS